MKSKQNTSKPFLLSNQCFQEDLWSRLCDKRLVKLFKQEHRMWVPTLSCGVLDRSVLPKDTPMKTPEDPVLLQPRTPGLRFKPLPPSLAWHSGPAFE